MVAAKFGVFGNNIETTGIQEKRALCHLPEDPPGGPASQVDQPRRWTSLALPGALFPAPKSWEPERSVEGPWESLMRSTARAANDHTRGYREGAVTGAPPAEAQS